MRTVQLYHMFNKRALVTRDAADALQGDVDESCLRGDPLALDLEGIQSITPSFLDQLLLMVESSLPNEDDAVNIVMLNSPPGLRDRLESIGRVHKLEVVSDDVGDWLVPVASLVR